MNTFDITIIVCTTITLACFCIVFLVLISLYYNSKKKNYSSGLYDDKLFKELNKNKKGLNIEEYRTYYYKHKRNKNKEKVFGIVIDSIISLILLCSLSFALFMKINNDSFTINNTQVLVVKTSSMSSVNSNNSYLTSKSIESPYKDTRIQKNELIAITTYDSESNTINLYDIVAFKMNDEVIVHRVVEIKESNGQYKYTFRGDSNPYSLTDEINVTEDRIIGVFNGFHNIPLGYIISYLQSVLGIISVTSLVICLIGYITITDKLEKEHDKAYEKLLDKKVKEAIEIPSPSKQMHLYVKVL